MGIISRIKKQYHILKHDGKKHYVFSSCCKRGSIVNKPYKAYNTMQVYKEGIILHNKLYHEDPYSVIVDVYENYK